MLRPPVGGWGERYYPLAAFGGGSVMGGLGFGMLLALLSTAMHRAPVLQIGLVIASSAIVLTSFVLPGIARWLPDRNCQLNKGLIYARSRPRVGFRWGVELGFGVCTFFVTPAVYVLVALGAMQRSALAAVIVGLTYGTIRGVTIVAFTLIAASRLSWSPVNIGRRVASASQVPLLAISITAAWIALT